MRTLAALISLGRFLFGAAFTAQPRLLEGAWIGRQARLPGAQVLGRAVGARDADLVPCCPATPGVLLGGDRASRSVPRPLFRRGRGRPAVGFCRPARSL